MIPWHLDMRMWTHAALTAIMVGLSVTLALPGDTMANPTWSAFRALASETTWSYMFMAAAWVGALGLVSSQRWVLMASTLLLSTAHTTMAWMFLKTSLALGVANTGVPTYFIIAALGFILTMIRFTQR